MSEGHVIRRAASYARIARAMGRAPGEVLFLSDVTAELDAARAAGMETTLLTRPGSAPSEGGHPRAETFDAIA